MSDNNEIGVKITGDSTGAVDAVQKAQSAVKDSVGQMNGHLSSLGDSFSKLNGVMATVGAILAGGAVFKAGVEETKRFTGEANGLAKALGISATEASTLNVALGDIYSSAETFIGASQMLGRQLRTNEEGMRAMGLETREGPNKEFRNMKDLMLDGIKVLNGYKEGTDRNLAAQAMFGRGGAEVMSMLKLNNEVLAQAKQKQEELGLVVGVENVAAAKAYKAAMNDVDDVMSAIRKAIGDAVMPVLTKMGEWFATIGPAAVTVVKGAIGGLIAVFWGLKNAVVIVWETINAMVVSVAEPIRALGEAVAKALTGDFKGAGEVIANVPTVVVGAWDKAFDEMMASSEETSTKIANLFNKPTATGAKESKGKDFVDPNTPDKKEGKGPDIMAMWKSQLEQSKEAEAAFFKDSTQSDLAYWQERLQTVTGHSAKEIALRQKVLHEIFNLEKQSAMQGRALSDEEISRLQKSGQDEIAMKRMVLDRDVAMDKISVQEKLMAEAGLAQEELQLEIATLDSKLELYQGDAVAHAKLVAQKEALERNYAKSIHKINTEILTDQKAQVQQWLGPMSSAVEKSVTGMIQGTITLRGALKNIYQSILGEFVSMMTKMLVKWVANEVAKTTAVTAGGAAQTAIATATATTTTATKATEATAVVGANAAEAGSGAAASVAAIPYVGWAMAAGVFASVMALVLGAKGSISSARGGFDIPSGVNPITQLHEEEMVLPKDQANAIRDMAGSGGGGGMNVHISTLDGRSLSNYLKSNSHSLAPAMRRMARNMTPVRG